MGVCFSTQTGSVKIVERFGEFSRVQRPGIGCLWCPCCCMDAVGGTVSLRLQQIDVDCDTKTQDNVFVKMRCSVQYVVMPERIEDAFYQLSDPQHQIKSYIFDVLRAEVPKVTLDELFLVKDQMSRAVKEGVGKAMNRFGFDIVATPITDIDPDRGVKAAMNEINRQERLKKAAHDKGEASKILMIKNAEAKAAQIRIEAQADADAKELAGQGLSRQRQAIVDGLQESVNLFTKGVVGADPATVMDMILITQYFDTLKDMGANSRTNTVFLPHQPGGLTDLSSQLRQGIMEAAVVSDPMARGCDPLMSRVVEVGSNTGNKQNATRGKKG